MQVVSILIPVFNEEKTIHILLERVFAQNIPGYKKEIIVINDGSIDKTQDVLKKWKKSCTVISLQKNSGKGGALSHGLNIANGDIVLIQDADLEYSPVDYPKLLEPFANPRVSVVYGSRFLGPHLSTMFVYALGNKFVTLLTNLLYNTNITDMETGYKAFRRAIVANFNLQAKRFDFEPEITAKFLRTGQQIYEVPISYFGRKFEEGKKLTWRDGVVALFTLLKFRFWRPTHT